MSYIQYNFHYIEYNEVKKMTRKIERKNAKNKGLELREKSEETS